MKAKGLELAFFLYSCNYCMQRVLLERRPKTPIPYIDISEIWALAMFGFAICVHCPLLHSQVLLVFQYWKINWLSNLLIQIFLQQLVCRWRCGSMTSGNWHCQICSQPWGPRLSTQKQTNNLFSYISKSKYTGWAGFQQTIIIANTKANRPI